MTNLGTTVAVDAATIESELTAFGDVAAGCRDTTRSAPEPRRNAPVADGERVSETERYVARGRCGKAVSPSCRPSFGRFSLRPSASSETRPTHPARLRPPFGGLRPGKPFSRLRSHVTPKRVSAKADASLARRLATHAIQVDPAPSPLIAKLFEWYVTDALTESADGQRARSRR